MSQYDLSVAAAQLKKLGTGLEKAAKRAMLSAAIKGVNVIQTQIIPGKVPMPVDRGLYRAGWKYGPLDDGAEIWNSEDHAAFIEEGVRPENVKIGRAMIAALAEWVVRKGLAKRGKDAEGMAWAIAKKMKQRGIFGYGQGLHVLGDLMQLHMPKILREEITREVEAELARRK